MPFYKLQILGNSRLSIEPATASTQNGSSSNGHSANDSSTENLVSKGTEAVKSMTEAIKRDDRQRFSLPRDDKRAGSNSNHNSNNNIAGSYFKSKFGNQNGDQVRDQKELNS